MTGIKLTAGELVRRNHYQRVSELYSTVPSLPTALFGLLSMPGPENQRHMVLLYLIHKVVFTYIRTEYILFVYKYKYIQYMHIFR
jgi:hypothetical protein